MYGKESLFTVCTFSFCLDIKVIFLLSQGNDGAPGETGDVGAPGETVSTIFYFNIAKIQLFVLQGPPGAVGDTGPPGEPGRRVSQSTVVKKCHNCELVYLSFGFRDQLDLKDQKEDQEKKEQR